jgi:hypothetical protein
MTVWRALLLVLLAINLLLFAAGRGWLGGGSGAPERLAAQLHPDKIRIVAVAPRDPPPVPPAVAEVPAAPPAPKGEPETAAAPAAEPAPQSAAPVCRRYAALARERAAALAEVARPAGVKLAQKAGEPASFWVQVPPQANREELERRIAELKQAGVTDYFVVQEPGANHNAISLGLFKLEKMAQDMREKLRAKGVAQVRIQAREGPAGRVAVELRGAPAAVAAVVAQAGLGELKQQPCD